MQVDLEFLPEKIINRIDNTSAAWDGIVDNLDTQI